MSFPFIIHPLEKNQLGTQFKIYVTLGFYN